MDKAYLRWFLKEFYIGINPKIWKTCKNYYILDNLIIEGFNNYDTIKYIISSLLLQHKKPIVYKTVTLFKFQDLQFDRGDDDRLTISKLLSPRTLIIKEVGDVRNSMYKELVSSVVMERHIRKLNTIIVLMTRKIDYLLNLKIQKEFKVINFNIPNIKMKNGSVEKNTDIEIF